MREYLPPVNDEERLFAKQVAKLAVSAKYGNSTNSTMFLSDRQQAIAQAVLKHEGTESYLFEGGFADAQRKILCFGMDKTKAKAMLSCVRVCANNSNCILTHRDYLGAFLSLGIKREAIGDIVVNADNAIFFALPTVAVLLCNELRTVSREAVSIQLTEGFDIIAEQQEKPLVSASVSSLRLDAVLAVMLRCSRSEAQSLVRGGLVEVNHIAISSVHYDLCEDDIITARGHGKYMLCEIGGKSRKDRTFVQFKQF